MKKKEFLRYWITKLSKKGHKKYHIYFLQDEEVDNYLPMNVKPKPDSINRIYIVAKPVNKNYNIKPEPQKLRAIQRKGFTLVDWGGMVTR